MTDEARSGMRSPEPEPAGYARQRLAGGAPKDVIIEELVQKFGLGELDAGDAVENAQVALLTESTKAGFGGELDPEDDILWAKEQTTGGTWKMIGIGVVLVLCVLIFLYTGTCIVPYFR